MFNQTHCEASLLSETKIQEITEACNVTQRKRRHHTKKKGAQIPVDERLQVTIEGQDESSRYEIGLKISQVSFFLHSQANYYSISEKPINDHHYVRWMNPDT